MISALMQSNRITDENRQILSDIIANGANVDIGRGLYPRFLPAGITDPGRENRMMDYYSSYDRISFLIAGPESQTLVVMPFLRNKFKFPNSSDILVFNCKYRDERGTTRWDIFAIAVFSDSGNRHSAEHNLLELGTLLVRNPFPTHFTCQK
jgi:hypothetical protein